MVIRTDVKTSLIVFFMQRVVFHATAPNGSRNGSKNVFERSHRGGPAFCSIQIADPNGSGIVDLTGGRRGRLTGRPP